MSTHTSTLCAKSEGKLLKYAIKELNQRGRGDAVFSTEQNCITIIKTTSHEKLQVLTVKTNVPKLKKHLIAVILRHQKWTL